MKQVLPYSKSAVTWMLVIPTLAWCYIGLFVTMTFWYPGGLDARTWQLHLLHFSIVYLFWMIISFSYRLFDWETLQTIKSLISRLLVTLAAWLVLAVLYFYFQPSLLITPRRFLLAHILISGVGIFIWFILMRRAVASNRRRPVYLHASLEKHGEAKELIERNELSGLQFNGLLQDDSELSVGSVVVLPVQWETSADDGKRLFNLRSQGVKFIDYPQFYEYLTRAVHLSALSELWFIHSVDYGSHQIFDSIKRLIDIIFGFIGLLVFVVTFPIVALAIKVTSAGKVIFSQERVGQNGKTFVLYKYRTMSSSSASNTWTSPGDSRITGLGKILRKFRVDELPQAINIIRGDMSIVGPRPEQVNIVQKLEEEIPYYTERHSVKPGLTGWAQLHVYAGSVEESRQKLQYDLYYIKHRNLVFDLEILVKTFYNIITFSGR